MATNQYTDFKQASIVRAREIFENNLQKGYSVWKHESFEFISPADVEYVYQWLWDTCFHAMVLSNFDVAWGRREIATLLKGQWKNGMVPHIIFWDKTKHFPYWAYMESRISLKPNTTAHSQPPLVAIAVERLHMARANDDYLLEVLPKIAAFHDYLLAVQDPDGDRLISIISPKESGLDESPEFQPALGYLGNDTLALSAAFRQPDIRNLAVNYSMKAIFKLDHFNVEELVFNSIWIEANMSLARLYRLSGNEDMSQKYEQIAKEATQALVQKCWNEKDGLYYSLAGRAEVQQRVNTIVSLVPLFVKDIPKEHADRLVHEHLLNEKEYWTEYPVPSVAVNEKYYNPNDQHHLWRGPTWLATNWLIIKGLQKHGYTKESDMLIERTVKLIQKSDFREFYNPHTGQGYRRENFGWSTLIVDLLD